MISKRLVIVIINILSVMREVFVLFCRNMEKKVIKRDWGSLGMFFGRGGMFWGLIDELEFVLFC